MKFGFATCFLFIGLSTACSAQPRVTVPAESISFERDVYGIEVKDSAGVAYEHPFLGGFNVPRPQFVDIDGDGDLDLFVQEIAGGIQFFEQIGTPAEPVYTWRSDQFQDLDVDEWYRFVDLDQDGDSDLLAERRYSYIKFFKNDGTPTEPRFSLAADSLKDVDGNPIFAERQNIPNLTDIDCDGNLDLFLGLLVGTVQRYEAEGQDENGILKFRHLTDRFEDIEIIAQFGSLHGANTLTFGDVDGDGDNDMLWGDFFEAGLLYIENTGTCDFPILRGEPVNFPIDDPVKTSGYNAPILADYDADGDLDLFFGVLGGAFNPNLTTVDNFYFYRHEEDRYKLETSRFLPNLDVGSESIPSLVDLDRDGDMDLVVSNKIEPGLTQAARSYYFENTGSATAPAFHLRKRWHFAPSYHYAPAFGDLDGDGDSDMMLGTWNKGIYYYHNDGSLDSNPFTFDSTRTVRLTRGSNSSPALVDIDADGDLDLFVGESSGTINFYENIGSRTSPRFDLVSDEYDDIDIGRRSFPNFTDADADGDFDMFVGSDTGELFFFRNVGTRTMPEFQPETAPDISLPHYATPVFYDIDGDGTTDVLSGGASGGVVLYRGR